MVENYALDPDEVAHGYVLTHPAHPTSYAVSVDFDAAQGACLCVGLGLLIGTDVLYVP